MSTKSCCAEIFAFFSRRYSSFRCATSGRLRGFEQSRAICRNRCNWNTHLCLKDFLMSWVILMKSQNVVVRIVLERHHELSFPRFEYLCHCFSLVLSISPYASERRTLTPHKAVGFSEQTMPRAGSRDVTMLCLTLRDAWSEFCERCLDLRMVAERTYSQFLCIFLLSYQIHPFPRPERHQRKGRRDSRRKLFQKLETFHELISHLRQLGMLLHIDRLP